MACRNTRSNSDECLIGVVGDNTIDRYTTIREVTELVGGNALNVAIQLSRAGVRVSYLGAVGRDREGRRVSEALELCGVESSRVTISADETATTEVHISDDGERAFLAEKYAASGTYYPSYTDMDWLSDRAWVHVGMLPESTRFRRELKATNESVVISQDCSVASGLSDLDVAFVSASTCEDVDSFVRDALTAGVKLVVVTRGEDGADAVTKTRRWHQQAFPTTVVDTLGAGDSFTAGVIFVLFANGVIPDALECGARLAAATCSHSGGWPQPGFRRVPDLRGLTMYVDG